MKEMTEALAMKAVNVLSSSLDQLEASEIEKTRVALAVLDIWLRHDAAIGYNMALQKIKYAVDMDLREVPEPHSKSAGE